MPTQSHPLLVVNKVSNTIQVTSALPPDLSGYATSAELAEGIATVNAFLTTVTNLEVSTVAAADQAAIDAAAAAASAVAAAQSATEAANDATTVASTVAQALAHKDAAAVSETNAATSATSASGSATAAGTSATNAATSETNAAASAVTAGTHATNASTSATAAAASKTAAETAQAAAEAAATDATSGLVVETKTLDYTIVLADAFKYLRGDHATGMTFTIPLLVDAAFAVGDSFVLRCVNDGDVTIAGSTVDVTLNGPTTITKNQQVTLINVAADEWDIA